MPAICYPHGVDMTPRSASPRYVETVVYDGKNVGQPPLNAAALERRRALINERLDRLKFTGGNMTPVDKRLSQRWMPHGWFRDGVFVRA